LNGFCFDIGIIIIYWLVGGVGVWLDGGMMFVGVEIGVYFDLMFVKFMCCGCDFLMVVW